MLKVIYLMRKCIAPNSLFNVIIKKQIDTHEKHSICLDLKPIYNLLKSTSIGHCFIRKSKININYNLFLSITDAINHITNLFHNFYYTQITSQKNFKDLNDNIVLQYLYTVIYQIPVCFLKVLLTHLNTFIIL